MAIEKPNGGYLSGLTDEQIVDLYAEELKADNDTYAGIALEENEKALLFVDILYGPKGLFVLEAHEGAGKLGKQGVNRRWAAESGIKAAGKRVAEKSLLRDRLFSHDIPEEQHDAKIEEINADVKKNHSGKENRAYHSGEMKRLKALRQAMGKAAFYGVAAD